MSKETKSYRNNVEVKKLSTGHIIVVIKTGEIVQAQAQLEREHAVVLLKQLEQAVGAT